MSTAWPRYTMVSLVLFAFASRAQAAGDPVGPDTLEGTRGLVKEARHEVAVTMHRGYAVLTVRRTLWNWGQRHDQGVYLLSMPDWTVATGLRSRGVLDGKPVWFAGELMEAEAAAAKYQKLTGHGGYYPKDPALLSWRNASLL